MNCRSSFCFPSFAGRFFAAGFVLSLALCCLCLAPALAADPADSANNEVPLIVQKAWIRAVPAVASDTAAYMVLINTGKKGLKLTGASTPIARMVHPMITTRKMEGGREVFGMELVQALEIPAGARVILAPSGDHLMLMEMTAHPKVGEKVPLILHFEPGGRKVPLEVAVLNREPKS